MTHYTTSTGFSGGEDKYKLGLAHKEIARLRAAIAEKDTEIVRLKEELDATNNRAMRYAITITELMDEIDEYASHRKQEE